MNADQPFGDGYMSPGEAADLVDEWRGRLDRFCAALAQQGFRVERDGLSVRIDPPDDLDYEEMREGVPPPWEAS